MSASARSITPFSRSATVAKSHCNDMPDTIGFRLVGASASPGRLGSRDLKADARPAGILYGDDARAVHRVLRRQLPHLSARAADDRAAAADGGGAVRRLGGRAG